MLELDGSVLRLVAGDQVTSTGSVALSVCMFLCVQDDLKLGKLLGSGGFGSVYKATLTNEDGTTTPVVVKKVGVVQHLRCTCARGGGWVGGLALHATREACVNHHWLSICCACMIYKCSTQTTSGCQKGERGAAHGAHEGETLEIVGKRGWVLGFRLTLG
jgi:hypothetical protein